MFFACGGYALALHNMAVMTAYFPVMAYGNLGEVDCSLHHHHFKIALTALLPELEQVVTGCYSLSAAALPTARH